MTISTTEKNALATKYGTDTPYMALTNGSPGSSGSNIANELASAGYARLALSWGSASGGVITATGSFTIAAGQAVTNAVLVGASSGAAAIIDQVAVSWTTNGAQAIANVTATFTVSG
jgi:hypothetical protein